jgi:predicted house-cleaning noncanonical NTP pyrophosphatase (MazG superfamily)
MVEDPRLVRDRIPERLRERGRRVETTTVDGERYRRLLVERAHAGLERYRERGELADLADAAEAVYALADHEGVDPEAFEAVRGERRDRSGGFDRGVVVESTGSVE